MRMIPRILHQVWLSPDSDSKRSPIPQIYQDWTAQFLALHPDWEYKLWTEENFTELDSVAGLNCGVLCHTIKPVENPALPTVPLTVSSRSNIVRLFALYQYGGVYLDMDVEPLRNMDELLEHDRLYGNTAFAGEILPPGFNLRGLNNSVLGTRGQHPWIYDQISRLPRFMGLAPPWGPHLLNASWADYRVWPYPQHYFYPYLWDNKNQVNDRFAAYGPSAPGGSYLVHHWALSWHHKNSTKEFEQLVRRVNAQQAGNTPANPPDQNYRRD